MKTIARDLVNMAKAAGLAVQQHYRESSSYCVDVIAPNGVPRTFRLKDSGSRADVELHSRIKRFARENGAVQEQPAPAPAPATEAPAAPTAPISIKPRKRITVKTAAPKSITIESPETRITAGPLLAQATGTQAPQDLTTAEIIRLGEWTKQQNLEQVPSLEALALNATSYIGHTVSEHAMREVMAATAVTEPEHWNPLPEPHIVIAQELARLMEHLGEVPSAQFSRFMAALA